jgi:hypothetical protein
MVKEQDTEAEKKIKRNIKKSNIHTANPNPVELTWNSL